jgi:hypothetical protein
MSLFHKIMNKLGRYRLIPDRRTGLDYMHRYYLFLKDRTKFPFNVTLHKIVRSDDPIFHDHPWSYMTIVLKGGYWEHTPVFNDEGKMITEFQTWRGPGSIIKRKANEFHWLELDGENPATTLFFMGPQQREWGFLVETKKGINRWIRNDHYLSDWKNYHEKYIAPKAANRKAL